MVTLLLTTICLLFTAPAFATSVSWTFSGLLPLGGTVEGSFQYDTAAAPIDLNVRHLSGNAEYALTDWQFLVTPTDALSYRFADPILFSSATSTMEFCVNHCLFGSGNVESFLVSNGTDSMRLAWDTSAIGTLSAPPGSLDQWGTFMPRGSELSSSSYVLVMQSGTIQPAAVPEPATWLLVASGAGVLGVWHWRRKGRPLWKHDNPSEADLAEQEFKRQEEAFKTRAENEPLFLSPYQDHFVIFYNGEILEHDRDLQSLTTRFFLNNPDVPAIIKKIGNNHPLIIDTPFFD
jgi:hypothetical protein